MFIPRAALALLFSSLALAQPDARALLSESSNALHGLKSYEIEQEATIDSKGGLSTHIVVPVKLAVSMPGKLRMESSGEMGGALTVSDGTNTWSYIGALRQYAKTPAVSNPETFMKAMNPGVAQMMGLVKAQDPYASVAIAGEEAVEVGGQKYDCYVVEATLVKIESMGSTMIEGAAKLWIDKKTKLALRQTTTATLEGCALRSPAQMTGTSRVLSFRLNEEVKPSLFVFTPPEGAKEVPEFTSVFFKTRPDLTGEDAAGFHLKAPDGQSFSLESLRGKLVLLNFWATWCEPCRAEVPMFEKLRQEFAPKGLTVFGVNAGEDAGTVRKFLDEAKLKYPVLLAAGSTVEEDYSVTAYPTVVLIGRDGQIVLYHVGTGSEQDLRANLSRLGLAGTEGK